MKHSIIANSLRWAQERYLQERFPALCLHLKFDVKSAGVLLACACREMTVWQPFPFGEMHP
jgi:hypothetical protein